MPDFNATKLTQERNSTHGDFADNARLSQEIKRTIGGRIEYSDVMREALDMIALKLSRIASGHPSEVDHWRDIAGYATLVVQQLEKYDLVTKTAEKYFVHSSLDVDL